MCAAILWRNTLKLIRVSTPLILFFRLVGRPEWRSARFISSWWCHYYLFFLRCFPALWLEHRNHFDPLISFSSLVLFDHHGIETHSCHQERWENRDEGSSSSDDELVKSSMMIDGKGRPRGRVIGSQWHVVQLLLQRFHRKLTRFFWPPGWLIQSRGVWPTHRDVIWNGWRWLHSHFKQYAIDLAGGVWNLKMMVWTKVTEC